MTSNSFNCQLCKKAINLNQAVCASCGHVNILLGYKPSAEDIQKTEDLLSQKKQDREKYQQMQHELNTSVSQLENSNTLLKQLKSSHDKLVKKRTEYNNKNQKLTDEHQKLITKEATLTQELKELKEQSEKTTSIEMAISGKPICLRGMAISDSTVEVEIISFDQHQLPSYLKEVQLVVGCSKCPIETSSDIELYVSIIPVSFEELANGFQTKIELPLLMPIPEPYKYRLLMVLNAHEEPLISIL